MLLKMIAAALCCQFSVEVKPSFTIEVEKPRDVVAVQPIATAPRFMAFFTATYCSPCRACKKNLIPQLEAAGYRVAVYEMTDPANQAKYGSVVTQVPTFIACNGVTGQWETEPHVGTIDLATAKWMLDGSSLISTNPSASLRLEAPLAPEQPVQNLVVPTEERVLSPRVAEPSRFIQWPGWGTIDLETYNRNCNCGMCQSIRSMQRNYQQRKQFPPQSKVTPDQEGTPDDVVEDLLDQMQLRTGDVLAELGCGDGRILIAAAKRGIRGIGVELDPVRAQVAIENIRRSGLNELIEIEVGDALEFDLSRATVATAYLYPPVLAKLAPKLKQLRVVGSPYHEIPGLPMTQKRDIWIYRNGEDYENVMANNALGIFRGSSSADRSGANSAGR